MVAIGWSIFLKTFTRQTDGVGGDNPSWDILIRKLDFQSQMKIYQQSQRLADVVNENAEHELRKFRRHIRDDKYMYVATRLTLTIKFLYNNIPLVPENVQIQIIGLSTELSSGYSKNKMKFKPDLGYKLSKSSH